MYVSEGAALSRAPHAHRTWERGNSLPRLPRRLTACLIAVVSAMPPSIAIATPVLGGPGTMRVCFEQQQQRARPPLEPPPTNGLCNDGLCVGHASVHSDSGSRAWGSGGCARCVEQQQQRVGHAPVHSDSDPRAWGSGDHARCVEQQQQRARRGEFSGGA